MKVLKLKTGLNATWGAMFPDEVVGKFVGWVANTFTLGILTFMLLWDRKM